MNTMEIKNISLLETLLPEWPDDLLPIIRQEITQSNYKIVILDDDPTGTQTSKDLPVLTHWPKEALENELSGEYPAFFILTNSRSLAEPDACTLAREIGTNLRHACEKSGVQAILISRSDSTLRGHFPAEVDAMAEVMGKNDLPYLVLPFFLEGGRYTVDDIHYVQEGDCLVPAAQTTFAKDGVFGFHSSNLRDWVAEKTGGRVGAEEVTSISLDDIRSGGPTRVAGILMQVQSGKCCVVNAVSYRDMEVLVSALLEVENNGKEFLYRTAASFVRTRTGRDHDNSLLAKADLTSSSTNSGGLFVIGSYVEKTSQQVAALLEKTTVQSCEVQVANLLQSGQRKVEILRVADEISIALKAGIDCAIYTSRKLVTGNDADSSLEIGQTVSDSLVEIVKLINVQPRYLVAKGGITSSDVATKGLGIKRAMVVGQALPGVPVWQLGQETRYPGMPYIIFPGNVGGIDALVQIHNNLD